MEETPFQAVPEPMGEEAYSGPLSGVGTAPTGSGADANARAQAITAARLLTSPAGPPGAGVFSDLGAMAEAFKKKPQGGGEPGVRGPLPFALPAR